MAKKISIECPVCGWKPKESDIWYCTCGHKWNTFITAGRCPSCDKQWLETQCHVCDQWSPHLDWYKDLIDLLKNQFEWVKLGNEVPI
jgi:hypothetical protein